MHAIIPVYRILYFIIVIICSEVNILWSLSSHYIVSHRYKQSYQHFVLTHPQSLFFTHRKRPCFSPIKSSMYNYSFVFLVIFPDSMQKDQNCQVSCEYRWVLLLQVSLSMMTAITCQEFLHSTLSTTLMHSICTTPVPALLQQMTRLLPDIPLHGKVVCSVAECSRTYEGDEHKQISVLYRWKTSI